MILTCDEIAKTPVSGILFCILILIIAGCQPVRELRSPCHVAASEAMSDCEFTPINRGAA